MIRIPADIKTLPNAMSIVRALLGLVVSGVLVMGGHTWAVVALIVMITAELSDVFDGEIARRTATTSKFGELVDPVCDGIYHLAVFLAFLALGWLPVGMLFIIFVHEISVLYMRSFAHQAGHELGVRRSDQIKNVVHALCQIAIVVIVIGLLPATLAGFDTIYLLLSAATTASLLSLGDYVYATYILIRN